MKKEEEIVIDLDWDKADKFLMKANKEWFKQIELLIAKFKKNKVVLPRAVPELFRQELENLFGETLVDKENFQAIWICGPKKPIYHD